MEQVNILLVDDREDNLLTLRYMLESLHENLVMATSGEQALEYAKHQDFAVILLDINLGHGLNGFDTATRLRAQTRSKDTPIIFLTAYGDREELVTRGYAVGAVDFMVKPVVAEILRAKVGVFVELFRKNQLLHQQLRQIQQLHQDVRIHKHTSEAHQKLLVEEHTARVEAEQLQQRIAYLAEASTSIAATLDYDTTINNIAQAIVPTLADYCFVYFLSDGNRVRHVTVAHYDQTVEPLLRELEQRYPMDRDSGSPLFRVLHSKQPELGSTKTLLLNHTTDNAPQEMLDLLKANNYLALPLVVHGQTLGAMLLVMAESGRQYTEENIVLAIELANRAALALDNVRLHQSVREKEEQYRWLIENTTEAVWCFELERAISVRLSEDEQIDLYYEYGYLAECNDGMARMYGYEKAEDMIGLRLGDILPRSDSRNIDYLRAFIRSGYKLLDAESMVLGNGGQVKYMLNNLIGQIDNGMGFRAWGTSRDITERKLAEAERDQLLVREHHARLEAEKAVQLRDEFLSVAAHELKTPITALQGFTQLLMRRYEKDEMPEPAKVRQPLRNIEQQTERLNRLITQLLDVSRIQSGRLMLEPQHVDLVRLVRDVVTMLQATTTTHTITVKSPYSVTVCIDPLRIEQVVTNLVSNAIKYSPNGGLVEVEIGLLEGQNTFLAVADQGLGIPLEQRQRLFTPFYRAAANNHIGGMGLGLFISQRIITLHGGEIKAEFPTEGGTRFVVTLAQDAAITDAAQIDFRG